MTRVWKYRNCILVLYALDLYQAKLEIRSVPIMLSLKLKIKNINFEYFNDFIEKNAYFLIFICLSCIIYLIFPKG